MMKFLLLASVIALTSAQYRHGGYGLSRGYGGPAHGGDGGYGGHDYAVPTPYDYGYEIAGGDHHTDFKQNRQESGDGHGNVKGSYGYTDSYGNYRQVDYVADHDGFRAQVRTNEPGTDKQDPAHVELHAEPARYDSYGGHAGGYGGPAPHLGGGYGAGYSAPRALYSHAPRRPYGHGGY